MRPNLLLSCVIIVSLGVVIAQGQILKPVVNQAKQTVSQTTQWFDEKLLTPVQSKINKAIELQKSAIQNLINVDPDAKFSTIFTDIVNYNVSQIKECYDTAVGDEEFNIFENSIFDGIRMYYVSCCLIIIENLIENQNFHLYRNISQRILI